MRLKNWEKWHSNPNFEKRANIIGSATSLSLKWKKGMLFKIISNNKALTRDKTALNSALSGFAANKTALHSNQTLWSSTEAVNNTTPQKMLTQNSNSYGIIRAC